MPRPKAKCYCCDKVYNAENGIPTCLPRVYLCDSCESRFERKRIKEPSQKCYDLLNPGDRLRLGNELVAWLLSALTSFQQEGMTVPVFSFITDNWRLTIDLKTICRKPVKCFIWNWGSQARCREEVVRLVKSISWETSAGHRKQIRAILLNWSELHGDKQ